jgi:uncharacterized Fe-S radical SAM superfamily protein PflX
VTEQTVTAGIAASHRQFVERGSSVRRERQLILVLMINMLCRDEVEPCIHEALTIVMHLIPFLWNVKMFEAPLSTFVRIKKIKISGYEVVFCRIRW